MLKHTLIHLISSYGYVGLFIAIVLGIVGLPLPDEILMTVVGYISYKGHLNYFITIFIAFLGSVVGMTISYFIGYNIGPPFLKKYGYIFRVTPEKLDKVKDLFDKWGKFIVTIGYFIPGIRYFTAYLAGISKWSYKLFIAFAFPGALLWVFTFISLGYYFGLKWVKILEIFHRNMIILSIVVIVGVAIWLFFRSDKSKQNEE